MPKVKTTPKDTPAPAMAMLPDGSCCATSRYGMLTSRAPMPSIKPEADVPAPNPDASRAKP